MTSARAETGARLFQMSSRHWSSQSFPSPIAQYCITARNTQLHLSKSIVLREVFFYALSLALLMVTLSDRREVDGVKRIYIQWYDGLLLFVGYIAYVLVCAYYESIVNFVNARFSSDIENVDDNHTRPLSLVADIVKEEPSMDNVLPFLRQITNEPSTNFHHEEYETEQELYTHIQDHQTVTTSENEKQGKVARLFKFLVAPTKPKPSTIHGLEDRIWNESGDGSLSCFLWEQSLFYTKTRLDQKAWQLRWCTFRRDGITSVPNRTYSQNEIHYPDFVRIQVDEAHVVLKMYTAGSQNRDCKYLLLLD